MTIGKNAPSDFIELVEYLRAFKSDDPETNLKLSLYTNASKLDRSIADRMKGVIDSIAITLDSTNESTLRTIGRTKGSSNYFERIMKVLGDLCDVGIPVRLHTVVSRLNISELPFEVEKILGALKNQEINLVGWKFFQYMSYDVPETDSRHRISTHEYNALVDKIMPLFQPLDILTHFKDVDEMNSSIFNILPTGIAQYRSGGSWATTKRSGSLLECDRIENIFGDSQSELEMFRKAHTMNM